MSKCDEWEEKVEETEGKIIELHNRLAVDYLGDKRGLLEAKKERLEEQLEYYKERLRRSRERGGC